MSDRFFCLPGTSDLCLNVNFALNQRVTPKDNVLGVDRVLKGFIIKAHNHFIGGSAQLKYVERSFGSDAEAFTLTDRVVPNAVVLSEYVPVTGDDIPLTTFHLQKVSVIAIVEVLALRGLFFHEALLLYIGDDF